MYVCLQSTSLSIRSTAIDTLLGRSVSETSLKVAYVYFDYKDERAVLNVASTILRQFLFQLREIPPELEVAYDNFVSKDIRAKFTTFAGVLTSLPRKDDSYFIVFDALDECSDKHRNQVMQFIISLQKAGFKILISSRLHITIELLSSETMTVRADESDIMLYATTRLSQEKYIDPILGRRCLEMVQDAQGMYSRFSWHTKG